MRHETAPPIETDRLILRGFERADFDAIYGLSSDPDITQYMGGPIESRSRVWEKFLRSPAMWALLGYGMWIVQRRADGVILGQIGYADFMRDINPPLADVPEMAWMLGRASRGPDGRGLGFGSEALDAVLGWGDINLGYDSYQCIISPDNIASIALAHKFGFTEIRRAEYADNMVIVMERAVPRRTPR